MTLEEVRAKIIEFTNYDFWNKVSPLMLYKKYEKMMRFFLYLTLGIHFHLTMLRLD